MISVLIRPLKIEDAAISYMWRNDPEVWKYTGSRPTQYITPEIEEVWIRKVLANTTTKRFAILADQKYIGNIQLTSIVAGKDAEYHVFIGDKNYWGKGIAGLATEQILWYAKEVLKLKNVYLKVHNNNSNAIKIYERAGFKIDTIGEFINMTCCLNGLKKPIVSIFMMVYNHEVFLQQAIDSILAQKCNFSFQVVVGEDCSSDNSRKILLEYVSLYPGKFKLLLHKKNIGALANQNAVFKACDGKYIALCEGDDFWIDPLKLQKQVNFLEEHPDFIIAASASDIMVNNKIVSNNAEIQDSTFTIEDIIIKSRFETASFIFRYQPKIIFPDWFFTYGSDVDALVFWILKDGHKAYLMKEVMSVYRYHAGGATKQKNYQQKVDYYIGMLDLFNESTNGKFDRSIKAKKLSVYTQFNLFILSYPKRISFILKNTFNYLRFPGNGSLTLKLLVKYFLPHTFRKV